MWTTGVQGFDTLPYNKEGGVFFWCVLLCVCYFPNIYSRLDHQCFNTSGQLCAPLLSHCWAMPMPTETLWTDDKAKNRPEREISMLGFESWEITPQKLDVWTVGDARLDVLPGDLLPANRAWSTEGSGLGKVTDLEGLQWNLISCDNPPN